MTDRFVFDEETHTYTLDGKILPSITQAISAAGLVDANWYTALGRFRGSAVHSATQLHDEDDLDESSLDEVYGFEPGELEAYLEQWRKFREDYEFEPTLIEKPLFHHVHLYAGKPDRAGFVKFNGRRTKCVVEIKTGASIGATREQTAAQVNLLEGSATFTRFELRVTQERYKLTEHPLRELGRDFASFLACVNVAKRQYELFGKIRENGGR